MDLERRARRGADERLEGEILLMYFSRWTLRTTVLDSWSAGGDDGALSIIVRHFVTRIDHHRQLNAACTTAPPQIPTLYLASAMRYLLYYSALSPAR